MSQSLPPGPISRDQVIIVGAGWAGLSAAATLAKAGRKVVLLEQAPILGGRARAANFKPRQPLKGDEVLRVDNGQHLLMGAYTESLGLIEHLQQDLSTKNSRGFSRADLFKRMTVRLRDTAGLSLITRRLPAPLHLILAGMTAQGLGIRDRFAMSYLFVNLRLKSWLKNGADFSVTHLLENNFQTSTLIQRLWRPLCLSALNTPPDRASAKVFAAILRDTLGAKQSASDFLVANVSLGDTLPELVERYLQAGDHQIEKGASVEAIEHRNGIQSNRWVVLTRDGRRFEANHVVLATPWPMTQRLLSNAKLPIPDSDPIEYLPIVTVYCYWRFSDKGRENKSSSSSERVDPIMLIDSAVSQQFGQWFFDLGCTNGGGRLASVVISGPGIHTELSRDELGRAVATQINEQIGWVPPDETWVVTEKNATFACYPGLKRPKALTETSGLFLCGDIFASPYPATLETASRSGIATAELLLKQQ